MKRALLSLVLTVVSVPAFAEQTGHIVGFEGQAKPKREKFFSPTNVLLTALQFGTAGMDVKTTLDCTNEPPKVERITLPDGRIRQTTYTCVETNANMQGAIAGGWGPSIGKKALENVPIAVVGHLLRRSDNKFLKVIGWVLPTVAIGWQTRDAIHNHSLLLQLRIHQ